MECPKCGKPLDFENVGYGFQGMVDVGCECGEYTKVPLDDCIDKLNPRIVELIKEMAEHNRNEHESKDGGKERK